MAEQVTRDLKSSVNNLSENVSDYVETYVKLTGLQVTKSVTEVATVSLTGIIILFFSMIVMIFLGLGLAAWFSEFLSVKEGYFCVVLINVLFAIIILSLRRKIFFPFLRNLIVRNIYASHNNEVSDTL